MFSSKNSYTFYFCDPDGHTEYVRTKEALPVDDRTPDIRSLAFRNIQADNCHVAAAFFYGLPEQKIGRVEMSNVRVNYAAETQTGVPAMMEGVEPMTRSGLFAANIKTLVLHNVEIQGQDGEAMVLEHIDQIES